MVRGLALVIGCLRNKKISRTPHSPQGLKEAKLIIIKQIQIGLYPDLDTEHPQQSSVISRYRRLGPILTSEGIWGVGGRAHGAISYPVLIPAGHACALILMESDHKQAQHTGVDSTLSKFREEYYVPYGNKLAKRVR